MAEVPPPNEIRVFDRMPVIVVEFSGFPSDAQFRAYVNEVESIASTRFRQAREKIPQRTAILFDTTDSTHAVTATQRRLQAEHIQRMKEYTVEGSEELTAVVMVIKQMLVRGVLTAVLWLQPSKAHFKVCATRAEADEFVRRWIVGTARRSDLPAA